VDENIVLIFPGLIFLVAGLGFLFARTDKSEKERDEKRFGPLSPFNIVCINSIIFAPWLGVIIILNTAF
jgi:hypothetical protein